MMTEGQLRGLASFDIEVGAHTVSHPILTRVSGATAQREIADSRSTLEAITSRRVNMFAYPNGRPGQDYDRSHVEMVRAAGFDAAVSTAWGAARRDADRFQIPRIRPWDRSALRFSARLLRTFVQRRAEQV
jgi:peptidoglycan/xylan/chitin deacetylase (PgdA/CDA1 family)